MRLVPRLAIRLCIALTITASNDRCVPAAAVTSTDATAAVGLTCGIPRTGFSRSATAACIAIARAGLSRPVTAALGRGGPGRGRPLAATAALARAASAAGGSATIRHRRGGGGGQSDRGRCRLRPGLAGVSSGQGGGRTVLRRRQAPRRRRKWPLRQHTPAALSSGARVLHDQVFPACARLRHAGWVGRLGRPGRSRGGGRRTGGHVPAHRQQEGAQLCQRYAGAGVTRGAPSLPLPAKKIGAALANIVQTPASLCHAAVHTREPRVSRLLPTCRRPTSPLLCSHPLPPMSRQARRHEGGMLLPTPPRLFSPFRYSHSRRSLTPQARRHEGGTRLAARDGAVGDDDDDML
jgi:hypothetical protein